MSSDAKLNLGCLWRFEPDGERPEAALLIELLEGIAQTGAIGTAAQRAEVSYRNAWGMLRRWEQRLGQPLVRMAKGRGSSLSELGEEFLRIDRETRQRVGPILSEASEQFGRLLKQTPRREGRVRIQASHDLVLELLADHLRGGGAVVDLEFRGSVEALSAFAAGQCDMAGFHCAQGEAALSMWSRYRPLLKDRFHLLMVLAEREQGIMVARGNPKGIQGLDDLAHKGVRFINRQSGAGTRILLDALLGARGISPQAIPGYGAAEFTHGAVAAMIASGQADAGLGIAAAAHRFGLDFLPLTREHYVLVFRRSALTSPAVRAVQERLQDHDFRAAAAALPGYNLDWLGSIMTPAELSDRLQHA